MIPTKIKIAGIEYGVIEEAGMESRYEHLGQILYTKGIINIDKDLPMDRKEQVLVHEILHGIFFEAGFEEQDEDMINRVGSVLYQVMKDNQLQFGGEEND